jgi:diguanylate cyclase (GGDEF)-like protein
MSLPLELLILAVSVLAALLLGRVWGRGLRGSLLGEQEEVNQKLRRAEVQIKESAKELQRMRAERDPVGALAMSLPQVIRDLNRDDLEPKDVPRLILTLAHSIFNPKQMLLYSVHKKGGRSVLVLSAQRGLEQVPQELRTVAIEDGKIGWVARGGVEMTPEGWRQLNRTECQKIHDNHPQLQADIMGPLVHQGKNGSKLLGVLSIGGLQQHPPDEKLMFQMVTNFASMAIINARNMSKLRTQADHDGLTGLFNKRHFLEKLAPQKLIDCERRAKPFTIFIFDIDNFKTYNDTNGHLAGDQLLHQMGELIQQHVGTHTACRYGGEEFVVAMADTTKEDGLAWAERLRQVITDQPFEHREKQPKGFVSISGGIATSPRDGCEVGVLLKKADEALYRSKENGRNRITPHKEVEIGDAAAEAAALDPSSDPSFEPMRAG